MSFWWTGLARQAMQKALDVRAKHRLGATNPICIYELCQKADVSVRFVPVNMEGLYVQQRRTILLGAMRPLPRRNFTCGHEFGHHVFGHGSKLDEVLEAAHTSRQSKDPDEFLVNTFSGFLLMPTVGVKKAFVLRGWNVNTATPEQFFTIACSFGVGYETLLNHLAYSAKMITASRAAALGRILLKQIRKSLLGVITNSPLVVADEHWSLPTLDAEAETLLLLPGKTEAESDVIVPHNENQNGRIFIANRPGIVRVNCTDSDWAATVRIARKEFVGLLKVRFDEEIEDAK